MSHFLGDGMKRTTDDLQCDWVDFRIGDVQFLPPGLELGHLPKPPLTTRWPATRRAALLLPLNPH